MALLKAETPVYGGYVIARDGAVVFIKGALPGEVVEVAIHQRRRDYAVASVTEVVEPSAYRVSPSCRHFGDCGGCQLQFISYEKQVAMKEEVLLDGLKRTGGIETALEPALSGPDFGYRRRGQFKVSKEGKVGFYREGTRDVVGIDECPLMDKGINDALRSVREAGVPQGIRELHITMGDCLLLLIKGMGFEEAVSGRFMELGFSGVAFDDGSYAGKGHAGFDLHGILYTVSPWSFFQSNWGLNLRLVDLVGAGMEPLEGKRVLDLYAGAGNFSLPFSGRAAEVVAVEENPHAVKDGQRNISLSGLKNYRYVKSSAEKAKTSGFDIVLLDPPRPGLSNDAIRKVVELCPERIVYISCNPATLARDLKKLGEGYEIVSVRLVDLFPNTYHIESVAFLRRR